MCKLSSNWLLKVSKENVGARCIWLVMLVVGQISQRPNEPNAENLTTCKILRDCLKFEGYRTRHVVF